MEGDVWGFGREAKRIFFGSPYTIEIQTVSDDSDAWSARVVELDGCFASGKTVTEAEDAIIRAALSWLETALAHGVEIPAPNALWSRPHQGKSSKGPQS